MQYNFRLGQLVSIWTTHTSHGDPNSASVSQASWFTSISPERDRNCHIMIQEHSDSGVQYKLPLGYGKGQGDGHNDQFPELMTLGNFTNGGHDVPQFCLLLCVKGVSPRKKITNAKGSTVDLVNVLLFDETQEASLTLWGAMSYSAALWTPSETVLMISNPGWKMGNKDVRLSVTGSTIIDVNPTIEDAEWLRGFASRLTTREHINPEFPANGSY
jgi:hypothetical protein